MTQDVGGLVAYSLVRATVKPMLKAKYKLFLFHMCSAFTKLKNRQFSKTKSQPKRQNQRTNNV